jgi:hypothetical protein
MCVRSVKYKIRFNNQETNYFTLSRGLRQGDPLSPYLFLICAASLSSLLAHREEVRGMKVPGFAEMRHQYLIYSFSFTL